MIDSLEVYIERATALKIAPTGFGISTVRKANNIGDGNRAQKSLKKHLLPFN